VNPVPGHQRIALRIVGILVLAGACHAADVPEIVTRATAVIQSDWAADPDYAYIEREETRKNGRVTSKTSQVVMMADSEYHMPTAFDDKPLSPEMQKAELQKLKNEYQRRNNEGPAARRHRIEKYKKERDENGELLLDFPSAFNFEILREEILDGHPVYVLSATPRKRNGPLSSAAKVLSGMDGTVWIDSVNFHVVRGDTTVMSPVPIYGILARVLPGTRVELDLGPVTDSIWLVKRFSLFLNVSKLGFKSSEVVDTTYTGYGLNTEVLKELLVKAGAL
jgi:hypothetical protein